MKRRTLPGTARGTEVTLDLGTTTRSAAGASGRVGVVVYPWEISLAAAPPLDGHLNAIAGAIGDVTVEGGRVRVRVGELVCECAPGDVDRLGLERGSRALATFPVAGTRLVALEAAF